MAVRDVRQRLGRFATEFLGQIGDIKAQQLEEWLRKLQSLANSAKRGGAPSGRTRNNYRNAIVALFNYAKDHGYLPKDLSTEASVTERVSEDDKRENEIFMPDQIEMLLHKGKPHLIPSMAIKAFSRVRTEEIAEMEWEHIAFKRGYIILPKAITKKKRRRIIPILPNLAKWLAPFEGLTGRICFRWGKRSPTRTTGRRAWPLPQSRRHHGKMPRTMLRYAIERFSRARETAYL